MNRKTLRINFLTMKFDSSLFVLVATMPVVAFGMLRGFPDEEWGFMQNRQEFSLSDPQTRSCNANADCGVGFYCASGQCLKMGTCGTEWDCRNPKNEYPIIECTGPIICNGQKQCERKCGPTCSDGTFGSPCLMQPCSFARDRCTMEDYTSCSNDFCGGCNALLFNDTGHHEFCNMSATSFSGAKTCANTSECGEFEYCSRGMCKDSGTCLSDADCFNKDNVYASILCVGPISCENGRCSRTCSDSNCPADNPPVECPVSECKKTLAETCDDEVANCVDYSCGDCTIFAFDAAGFQVCTEDTSNNAGSGSNAPAGSPSSPNSGSNAPAGSPSSPNNGQNATTGVTSCKSAKDCKQKEFCAGGKCLPDGACVTDIDCRNPTNSYPMVACIGLLSCQDDGICGVQCGASMCPDGVTPVECLISPCSSPPSCQESWKYCIDDYCNGGCDFILLDAAGNPVTCTPV